MSTVITDEDARANISANIKAILRQRDLSQYWLARVSGENQMTVSRIARGIVMPGAAVLHRIAEALGVSSDFLISHRQQKKSRRRA